MRRTALFLGSLLGQPCCAALAMKVQHQVTAAHLAELLGHSTTAMIHQHYGYLFEKGCALRNSLDRIRRRS
jgi:hypothetical protein